MKIQVAYGRVDPAGWLKCPRCEGRGEAETAFQSGVFQVCPYCNGSGANPHPRTYTYSTDETVGVGDVVLVPGNWVKSEPQEATVIVLGSDYDGSITPVSRVIERKEANATDGDNDDEGPDYDDFGD